MVNETGGEERRSAPAGADPVARTDAAPAARAEADPAVRAEADQAVRAEADPVARAEADPVARAEAEAQRLSDNRPVLGTPGPPLNRRSPFMVGLLGAGGVGVAYALARLLLAASGVLVLVGVALFLAVGLEPAVAWLGRTRMPRVLAVPLVALLIIGVLGGFLALALPPLIAQIGQFIQQLPAYIGQMRDHSTTLGHLDARFHIEDRVRDALAHLNGPAAAEEVMSAGRVVVGTTFSIFTVLILTVYLMFDLPRIRRLLYRLTPASRRARVILIGDEISGKVGQYVLGNLITSLIAGVGTAIWLLIFDVPYPIVLGIMVALLDLIPIVGSTVAGIIVSLIALTVSLPVAIATAAFYIAYRLLEDYLLVPRIIGRAVRVPATVTILAVLVGGAAGGLLGALVAIPVAAAIDILLRELLFPRLDEA